MTRQQLRALIWKDIRLNRVILILGGCLLLFAYLVSLGIGLYLRHYGVKVLSVGQVLFTGGPLAMGFAAITTALLGANAVAAEYADRSATFLAYQPPTRQLVTLSKLICGLAPSLLLAGIGFGTLALSLSFPGAETLTPPLSELAMLLLSAVWLIFAASWSMAGVTRCTAIGVVAGICAPIAVAVITSTVTTIRHPQEFFCLVSVVFGTILFGTASVALLRREDG